MKYLGGFFELEIPGGRGPLHTDAVALSTGRACFSTVLQQLRPKRVHLPFYMCDALIQVARAMDTEIAFYSLDHALLPLTAHQPEADELVLAMNYFGLQSNYTVAAAQAWGRSCLVDNTQAFFELPQGNCWTLYSARKFFGVPDGAYLYAPEPVSIELKTRTRPDVSHLVNRLAGRQQLAYRQCRRYEASIDGSVRKMSELSERILSALDYGQIASRRRSNYLTLHEALGENNKFDASLPTGAIPYCYPMLMPGPLDRAELAKHRLYVPTIWQDVVDRATTAFSFERSFARNLLPLPIDQRYDTPDMQKMIRILAKVDVIDAR